MVELRLVDVATGEILDKPFKFRSTLTSLGDGTRGEKNSGVPSVPIDEKGYTDLSVLYERCRRLPPALAVAALDRGEYNDDCFDDVSDGADMAVNSLLRAELTDNINQELPPKEAATNEKNELSTDEDGANPQVMSDG